MSEIQIVTVAILVVAGIIVWKARKGIFTKKDGDYISRK